MLFGITLGAFNYTYFGDRLSLYFVWIPQMLFMTCTFGEKCRLQTVAFSESFLRLALTLAITPPNFQDTCAS
eukprot:1393635-Amorphochlora_amoeboformis.AAC.1